MLKRRTLKLAAAAVTIASALGFTSASAASASAAMRANVSSVNWTPVLVTILIGLAVVATVTIFTPPGL